MRNLLEVAAMTLVCTSCSPAGVNEAAIVAQNLAPYTHKGMGFVFPISVGEFKRIDVTPYNAEETDIGVGYNLTTPGRQTATTVFIYPATAVDPSVQGKSCTNQFESIKADIVSNHPGSILVQQDSISSPSPTFNGVGKRAIYRFNGVFAHVEQSLQSEADLFCYVRGDWFIAYRTTAPINVRYRPILDRLMRELAWPPTR